MKNKRTVIRFPKAKPTAEIPDRSWHNGGDIEIGFYVRSLQKAAKTLIDNLDLEPNPKTAWDTGPVLLLYRQAVELRLKALVGEGSKFLPSPTDSITLSQTHSVRWLAQVICQIIRAVKWENQFKCEGVSSLADFSAVVAELEALDPVSCSVRSSSRGPIGSVPPHLQPTNVVRFARKLDALLDLLVGTANSLAATWDLLQEGILEGPEFDSGGGFEPTIQ